MQIALTVYPGVSADECEAFTMAFGALRDVSPEHRSIEFVTVGERRGKVVGPAGGQTADLTFEDVRRPDVVLVPGGLGADRTAHDDVLLDWLRAVEQTCQWMAASSTGTVVVAAAGLLDARPAATHWLAGTMLEEYGSHASDERIVEVGRVLTCHGRISALDVSLLIIMRLYSRTVAADVRAAILAAERPRREDSPHRTRALIGILRSLGRHDVRGRRGGRARRRPRNEELDSAEWIEMELTVDESADG